MLRCKIESESLCFAVVDIPTRTFCELQDQPRLTQAMPQSTDAEVSKAPSKRPRKIWADDDSPYTPAAKRKKALGAATLGESSRKATAVQKGKQKAARLAEIDTPVIRATQVGKLSAGQDCKRRLPNRREKSEVAGRLWFLLCLFIHELCKCKKMGHCHTYDEFVFYSLS